MNVESAVSAFDLMILGDLEIQDSHIGMDTIRILV